jgi:hypothetical protein
MNQVQVEQKSYQMPPQEGFTVAHFLTVADVEPSTTVFFLRHPKKYATGNSFRALFCARFSA